MKKILLPTMVAGLAAGLWALPQTNAFSAPAGRDRTNTGPLFWMHGTETETQLRDMVGRVAESGQGILTIESRPHIDWMRAGWWRDVDIVLDACRKRGLKMMVFDDYWWPSQGMGGKYPIPEKYQCRDIVAAVYAKGEAPEKVENEICRVVATETAKGVFSLNLLGDKTIVYSWRVPPNGRVQGLGGSQGRFPYVNGLDEEAVDWFLANYYQPYYDRYRSAFEDGTIPGFFFDEPETMGVWGPALEKELKARGESIGELLTAFKFKLADREAQARALYRYHDARAEVWGRTMYGRQSEWCRRHGVFSSGHFMEHDNCFYSLAMSGGNVMQLMKYVEVPGVDLVCRQYYPHQREDRRRQIEFGQMPKIGSSTAHVYNRHNGLNWCEIFGAYGQDLTYPQMKWLCDWHQYQGCYYLIPHSFNPKAPYDTDCPPYFYNGGKEPRYPLFRVWADYNNRCARLLSDGEHVCHIAQCVPGMSAHVGRTIRPEMFAFAIQDAQLDSDWMLYDAVESAKIGTNPRTGRPALRTTNGKEWYDILTLPATEYVPVAVLEKALAFAKAGGVVVGYGFKYVSNGPAFPCNTPTRGKTSDDVKRVVDAIFAQPTALFLEGEPNGAQLRAALAKNYPGTDKPLAVRDLDFRGLSAEDGRMLAVNRYEKDGDRIFFIANQDCVHPRNLLVVTDPAKGLSPAAAELWDPMQGTVEKPALTTAGISLRLAPSGAAFLVWPKKPTANVLPRVEQPKGAALAATVKETVAPVVMDGDETAVDRMFRSAKWIWHPVNRDAAGKVTFRTTVDLAKGGTAKLVFSCDNAAEVRVNGTLVAKQDFGGSDYSGWRTPTKADVAFAAGRSTIEVVGDNAIPGPAGFLAAFKLPDGRFLLTDANWDVTRDGKTFVKAGDGGTYGCGPWGGFGSQRQTASPIAESVETTLAFTCPKLAATERLYLVCDDVAVEQSAAVTVNGAFAGGFIGAPYRLDVTRAAKAGDNTLVIKPFRVKNPRLVVQK